MKDFTQGNEGRLIFFFTLPMLFGNVFQQLYNTVDSIVVGRALGEGSLAAVGSSFPIIFLMISLIMGVTMGSTIIISQSFGAKNMENVKKAMDTAYVFLMAASVFVTVSGLLLSGPILKLLNVPDEIFADAKTYLNIIFAGTVGAFGFNSISAILRGLGDSKTPIYFLISATIANIILDLAFVLVFHWGVAGVAWATIIAQAASFIGLYIYLSKTNPLFKLDIRNIRFDWDIFVSSLKIGLPTGIQQVMVSLGMMSIQSLVNGFGTVTMAAYTAAGRLDSFAMMPAMNFSQAITAFTGQNIGARKPERVRKGFRMTVLMAGSVSVAITLVMFIWGRQMMQLFNTNQEVVEMGRRYLMIVSAAYIIFSTMFVSNGLIRGTGHTMFTMLTTLGALWVVRAPAAVILSGKMGPDGIWWSIPLGWAAGMTISLAYYFSGKWTIPAGFKASVPEAENNESGQGCPEESI